MNIKNVMRSIFSYKPKNNYEFYMPNNKDNANNSDNHFNDQKIYSSLDKNLEFVQSSYNTLINSDIIIRPFTLNARGKQYNSFLLYIDGMVDTNIMNDFILNPLMLRTPFNLYNGDQSQVISESVLNNITIKKVKKFDISDYLFNNLMPQNSVNKIDNFKEIFSGINSGNCALFVDTLNIAFDIEVKGFKQRGIDSPNNEIVVKGSQEAFVENIRTNTSILRRIINNEKLVIENVEVGKITKTKCGICYMQNITNSDLVSEVKYRINNLSIDSLISSGELEQLISEENELRNSRNDVY